MASAVDRLQAWYLAQCDGEWEHGYGVRIGTLDNPGWRVEIHLEDTRWAGRPFEPEAVDRTEHDWYRCWITDNRFEAACGPCNLGEAIGRFLDWAGVPDEPAPTGQAVDDTYRKQCDFWSET